MFARAPGRVILFSLVFIGVLGVSVWIYKCLYRVLCFFVRVLGVSFILAFLASLWFRV